MTETKMCQYCGEEVKLEAIKCKHCQSMLSEEGKARVGAVTPARPVQQAEPKVKKPLWKRWWAWAAVIIVLFIFIVTSGGGDENTSTSTPSASTTTEQSEAPAPAAIPMVVTTDNLIDDLRDNALKASNTYKDQYVELTGKLSNIDSSGDYFSLSKLSDDFSFDSVLCRIDENHLDTVMNFTMGQQVTVTGTITEVGEVLGYTMKVETIK